MSPIAGLTDQHPEFPEIGQVRKGAPKEPNRPGRDLNYFRFTFDAAELEASAKVLQIYGAEPDELNVMLPFRFVDENFDTWREAYVAGAMIHRCDGERVIYEIEPDTGAQRVVNGVPVDGGLAKTCNGVDPVGWYRPPNGGESKPVHCKPVGRLKVILPELGRLAYLTVLTSSIHDIVNLSRQLYALYAINGSLSGIPLRLRRRPTEISVPDEGRGGKRVRREKRLLSIEADPEWVKKKLVAMKAAALPGNGLPSETPALEAPKSAVHDWGKDEAEDESETTAAPSAEAPKTSAPETPPPPEAELKPIKAQEYWETVFAEGLTRQDGLKILSEQGNNFAKAHAAIKTRAKETA